MRKFLFSAVAVAALFLGTASVAKATTFVNQFGQVVTVNPFGQQTIVTNGFGGTSVIQQSTNSVFLNNGGFVTPGFVGFNNGFFFNRGFVGNRFFFGPRFGVGFGFGPRFGFGGGFGGFGGGFGPRFGFRGRF